MRIALSRFRFYWLLFFIVWQPSYAQQPVVAQFTERQEFPIEQISLEQGLSQGMIFSMLQDSMGYIWAATKEGLNRYDGTGFKVFRHNPDDSLSISDNVVTAIALDKKQRLWVGTATNGLNLFDPATESFIHFAHKPGQPQSIPSNNISTVCIDGSGNLVFEMTQMGYVVVKEKPGNYKNLNDAFEFKSIDEIYPQLKNVLQNQLNLARFQFSSGGELWYYARDTIHYYTTKMLQNGTGALRFFYPRSENVFYDVCAPFFFDATQNRTYITSQGNVLKQFNPLSKIFEPVLQLPAGYTFNHSLFIDAENNVWSWQPDNSIIKVNIATGKLVVINLLWEKISRGAIHPYYFVFEGINGNLWMRSGGYGIFKISARNKLFKQQSVGSPRVTNALWCQRIEKRGVKAAYYSADLEKLINRLGNIKSKGKAMPFPNHYFNFALDNKGLFWTTCYNIKTDENSIACINPESSTYKVFRDSFDVGSSYYASPVFLDNSGEVWFGEGRSKNGINLYHFNQKTKRVEGFRFPVEPNHNTDIFIADYYQDADGLFWLATRQGLFSFQPQTKQWQHFVNKPGNANTLSKDLVLSLCPDPAEPNRYLWVGTEGGGLNRFDKQSKTFTRFDVKNGLPNNVIYAIQSDAHNNLWISTNHGICQFNPQTFKTRNFTQADGLVSNEFNRYEFSKTTDGTLYFGSPNGISYFQPEDFYKAGKPSSVVINKLELLNKQVVYEHRQSSGKNTEFHLTAPIEHCKELVFDYNVRMITLGFTLLDLTVPAQNRFKYMLQGFDKDWIAAGTKNEATYTNLSPGSYVFKVMGCNGSNIWSTKPASIKITVLPPWWATWWFRTLSVLFFVSFLYALYRYRVSKILELERVRNRIAQDLHDEIGSTLSSISLYSAAIQKNPNGLSSRNHHILTKISQSTTKMMESMNDMVWTIKADNDNFEHVVNRMRAFAVNMTEAKDIQLHFNANTNTHALLLNMEQRKNIYLIFKEVVNNAVKYSGCSHLYIAISTTGNQFELSIKDDGAGFELEEVSQNQTRMGGNGLRGIRIRAKQILGNLQIQSAVGRGTEVVFSMTLS